MAQWSNIDAYVADLGVKSDAEIAKLAGVSVSAVYQYRHARGIGVVKRSTTKAGTRKAKAAAKPEPHGATRKGGRGLPSRLDAHRDLLGVLPDAEVALRVGLTRSAVALYRVRHGIPSASAFTAWVDPTADAPVRASESPAPAAGAAAGLRPSKLDAFADIVGVLSDAEVARRAGVTREGVRQYRLKRTRRTTSGSTAPSAAPTMHPAASATRAPSKTVGELMCWRVTLSDGSVTHLAAIDVVNAAARADAALGDRVVGLNLLGEVYP